VPENRKLFWDASDENAIVGRCTRLGTDVSGTSHYHWAIRWETGWPAHGRGILASGDLDNGALPRVAAVRGWTPGPQVLTNPSGLAPLSEPRPSLRSGQAFSARITKRAASNFSRVPPVQYLPCDYLSPSLVSSSSQPPPCSSGLQRRLEWLLDPRGDTMPVTLHVQRDSATGKYSATFDTDRLRVSGHPVQTTSRCNAPR